MNHKVSVLRKRVEVDIVNLAGARIGVRDIFSPLLAELYPQYLTKVEGEKNVYTFSALIIVDGDPPEKHRPGKAYRSWSPRDIIAYQGREYDCLAFWGSAIKKRTYFGILRGLDPLVEQGLIEGVYQYYYGGRQLLADSMYGAASIRGLRIRFARAGEEVAPGVFIADGHSAWRESLVGRFQNKRDEVDLKRPPRQSFQFWQRLDWNILNRSGRAEQLIEENIRKLDNPRQWLLVCPWETGFHDWLVACNERMSLHPFTMGFLQRSSKDTLHEVSTTIPIGKQMGITRIAVPDPNIEGFALPKVGPWVVVTFPNQSDANNRAVVVEQECQEYPYRVNQYTATADIQLEGQVQRFVMKGIGTTVPDDLMPEGVDIIFCSEDIKMTTIRPLEGARELVDEVFVAGWAFIGITMAYGRGTAIRVNPALWKTMGRDFDGDYLYAYYCQAFPELFEAVDARRKDAKNHKIPKAMGTYPLDRETRAAQAIQCSANLVGVVTIAYSSFLSFARGGDKARKMARQLHYSGENWETALDDTFNFFTQVGTDVFKSDLTRVVKGRDKDEKPIYYDEGEVQEHIFNLSHQVECSLSGIASHARWRRMESVFTTFIPRFVSELGVDVDGVELKAAINDEYDGTVAQILKRALPEIRNIRTLDNMASMPLAFYRSWAGEVDTATDLYKAISREVTLFNAALHSEVNWQNPSVVRKIKNDLKDSMNAVRRAFKVSWKEFGRDLWFVAHSASSGSAVAALWVLEDHLDVLEMILSSESAQQTMTRVVTRAIGLDKTVGEVEEMAATVRVINHETLKRDKRGKPVRTIVTCFLSDEGLAEDEVDGYPAGYLAEIPWDSRDPRPIPAVYMAGFKRLSPKAWEVTLSFGLD